MANNTVRDRLLKKYPSSLISSWKIYGEDPNPDMGGHHHQQLLQVVNGTYSKVVDYALDLPGFINCGLPGFINWGFGGKIEPCLSHNRHVDVDKIHYTVCNNNTLQELNNKKLKLISELAKTEEELKNYWTKNG